MLKLCIIDFLSIYLPPLSLLDESEVPAMNYKISRQNQHFPP